MAWSVELAQSAERELAKLDPQHRTRILKYLRDRVAKLDDPRSLGEHCEALGSESSGNVAWEITGSSAKSKTTGW
ncbi:MAG: type II toxin-antitoxin system RelE family toxin [Terriglobia bacterium]